MNVSFLSSSGSFSGVRYNERKVSEGKAYLVKKGNFEGLDGQGRLTSSDYIHYFNLWSDTNSRAKNKQLHIAISCKGREKSVSELVEAGLEWLELMGYKDVPYLIYSHIDTDNNHIHIVASRIDQNGKKINDSNEIWRSQSIINNISNRNLLEEFKSDIDRVFEYRYENENQFKVILERMNYKLKDNGNNILVYKGGILCGEVDKKNIYDRISIGYVEELKDRRKQIASIIRKYQQTLKISDMIDFLRNKIGLDVVFFGKKDSPYGYIIIDHKEKCVYKGGSIMRIKDLLGESIGENINLLNYASSLIRAIIENSKYRGIKVEEINSIIKRSGYLINTKGEVYYNRRMIGVLSQDLQREIRLLYNIYNWSSFSYSNESSINFIKKKKGISFKGNIGDFESNNRGGILYKYYLNTPLEERKGFCVDNEIQIQRDPDMGKTFLIDYKNKHITEVEDKGRDLESIVDLGEHNKIIGDLNFLDTLLNDTDVGAGEGLSPNLKKKRR